MNSADVTSRLRRMSSQRWILAFAAVVSAMLVPIVTGIAGSGQSPIVLAVVVGLAGASVTRPDSHVALMIPIVAAWYWTATTGASTSAWSLLVALCLFAFHALVALMSTTPPRATIDPASISRWSRRSAVVVAATGAVWLLVVGVDRLDLAGSAIMTAIGFVVATTLLVAMIAPRRTQPAPSENVAQRSSSSHSAIHRSR